MNKMKITNVDNVLLIFLLLMRPSNSIKLSISKKEFDDFYSQLLNDDAAGDQKYFEKAKLRLEMAMFGHEIEETFKNINQMQLAECQKQIFEQKRRDFDELMGSIMEISYRDKCELWKFWNDLEYTIEKNQLKTVRMDNFYAIIRYQNPNGPFEVNCERVGRELSDKNGIIDGELEEKLKAFSADTKSAHFGAILFLLGARRDGEEAGSICGILREGSGIWEFSKYFGTKQLENESNFAYQLRMLRIINEPKKPILMGLDLIDEATLSEEYFRIVSDESITFVALIKSHSELREMLRFEWANDDVVRLQIKNYIKFLDNDSQEKLWEWAKFHLDVLAHYQWLKKHMKNLAKAKQELINNNLVALKNIYVNGKRANEMFGAKAEIVKMLVNGSIEAARADFSGPSGDPKQKEAQICYMNSFLSRMMGNGTLGEESESWRKYLKTRGSIEMKQEEGEGDDELNRGVPSSAESDQKWEKPNCEDSVLSSRVLNKLAKSPILEENFVKVLSALFKKFPQFLQFVGQSLKAIPTFETLEDNEKAAHYKNLLENGKFRDEKGTFSLRLLWERANLLRKEFGQKFHKEIFEANAHLVAVLRVVRVFAAGEFAHLRMICLMAKFVYFLEEMSEKRPDKEWHFLNSCFKMETPELWHLQQKHTANEHFKFFATFLANCPRTNEIAAILRENEPSLLNLRNILGKENMKKLWEIPQIRDKLLDRNFFNDKLRLLALYRQVIGGQSKCARMGARIGADISVWANWNFVRMSGDGNSSANGHLFGRVSLMPPGEETLLDDFWLFFRLSFSKCRNWAAQIGGTNGEEGEKQLAKLSVELNSLIPAIDQFIADGRKNKKLASDVSKYLNLWREREKAATAQIAFRSIESAPNECAGPIESVQKLHFANFSAFLNEQNAGPIKEAFDLLIAALTEKKKAQKNLSLALSLIGDQKFENVWTNLGENERKEILFRLLGPIRVGPTRFAHLTMAWRRMREQIEIDQMLYDKLLHPSSQIAFLLPTFPLYSQQLNFAQNKMAESKLTERFENYLTESFHANSVQKSDRETFEAEIKGALMEIKQMVDEWSRGRARLLISGSFLLGAHTIHSDIDLICAVPGKAIKGRDFFGDQPSICKSNRCFCSPTDAEDGGGAGANLSLFCRFCRHKKMTKSVAISVGRVPMIQIKFAQIPFDISFVSFLGLEILPPQIGNKFIALAMQKLDINNGEHKKTLRILSSYQSTVHIANLVMDGPTTGSGSWGEQLLTHNAKNSETEPPKNKNFTKNAKNFRLMLLALKLWAKNFHIYSNKYGFLNGVTITILAAKIILLFPGAPNSVPVQLESLAPEQLIWLNNIKTEKAMAVLTPAAFATQNAADLITNSTAQIIRMEMDEALTKIIALRMDTLDWALLLSNPTPFVDKFETFILINCMAEQSIGADEFCQFVDGRIRWQLFVDIDQSNGATAHLWPDLYSQNCEELSNKFISASFRQI
uniref:polynucleotide adenylyltransferase n=1 Tax=Globodera pallida TaxID=36090 RepID=A0A183CFM4_GLOPA